MEEIDLRKEGGSVQRWGPPMAVQQDLCGFCQILFFFFTGNILLCVKILINHLNRTHWLVNLYKPRFGALAVTSLKLMNGILYF